jgi:uncharacterized protein YjiS (DUF1127 family)
VKPEIKFIRFTYTSGMHYSQYSLIDRKLISHKLIGAAMIEQTVKYPVNLDASSAGLTENLSRAAHQWIATLRLKITVRRERAQLLAMSDAMLRDIGIDRAAAEHEARREDIPAARSR